MRGSQGFLEPSNDRKRKAVTAIVLAAGTSKRFGEAKQLAEIEGRSMLETSLDGLRRSGIEEVVLVLGHKAHDVLREVETSDITVVINPRYEMGMSASIKAGLEALRGAEDAVLVVLADQPFLRPQTVDGLLKAYERSGARAVAPVFRGRRGNPVLLDLSLRGAMESLEGDRGCRELLAEVPDVLLVDVDDPGVLIDVDTPEDLARAREQAERMAGGRADDQ